MVSSHSRYQCLIRKLMISAVIATQALQSILIELQGTLLRHLWAAQENDNMTDFNVVVDASDFGRIRSVTVLNELYMRMAQAAPIPWQPPNMERVHTLDPTSGSAMPWETVTRAPPGTQSRPIVQALPSSPTVLSSSPNDSADLSNLIKLPGSTGRKWGIPFKSRLLRDLWSAAETSTPRDHNISNEPVSKSSLGIHVESNAPSIWEPPPQASIKKPSTHESHLERPLSGSWKPSPELRIDEDNPWREETSASSIRDMAINSPDPKDTQGLFPGPRRTYTGQTLVGDEGLLTRKFKGAHISSPSTSQTSNPAPSIMSETASPELKSTSGKFTSMFRRSTTSDAPQVVEKPPKPPLKRLDNSRKSSPIVSRKNPAPENPAGLLLGIPSRRKRRRDSNPPRPSLHLNLVLGNSRFDSGSISILFSLYTGCKFTTRIVNKVAGQFSQPGIRLIVRCLSNDAAKSQNFTRASHDVFRVSILKRLFTTQDPSKSLAVTRPAKIAR